MKVKYHKPTDHEPVLDDDISKYALDQLEMEQTKEIDLARKLSEYIDYFREDYKEVQRIIMHHRLFRALKHTQEFQRTMEYSGVVDHDPEYIQFYGVEILPMDLGTYSIDDFIIITEHETVHSDMVEKDFIQDMGVEEALRETNDMIDERDP